MDTLRRWYRRFRRFFEYIGRRQLATIAAATAFWFFLSLVPMVMLAASVLPYTALAQEQVLAALTAVLPDSLTQLIGGILADIYATGPGVLSVSVAATLWSSAMGFSSLIRGLELIHEAPHMAGYLLRRARGILCTVAMILSLVLSIVLGGFGRQLAALVARHIPGIHGLLAFLLHFRVLVVAAFLTVFFCAIFRWGTSLRPPLRQALPGALLAAAGWLLFSWAFSVWVRVTGGLGTYGSLATVVLAMLWLYYCQYILLLGACFNRSLPLFRRHGAEEGSE